MNKTFVEWCSTCDGEQELPHEFVPHICSCGEVLLPCSICEQQHEKTGCSECPFEIENEMYINKDTMEEIFKKTGEVVSILDLSQFGVDQDKPDIYLNIIRPKEADYKGNIIFCIDKKIIKITKDEYLSCIKDV